MEVLSDNTEVQLQWVHPQAAEQRYELRGEGNLFAELRFEISDRLATTEVAGGRWTFKRMGFFKPLVTVHQEGEESSTAVYRSGWPWTSKGCPEFADGRVFRWERANFWGSRYKLSDADGNHLIEYKLRDIDKLSNLFKRRAFVEIYPQAYDLTELPLLVPLGWYLMTLRLRGVGI